MIDFLLKSTISLTIFLGFYHLVLEREKMHQFNRFYLLFTIIISFIIPFLTFEIIKIVPIVQNLEPILFEELPTERQITIKEKINFTPYIIWSIYILVSFILLLRFGKNIWNLIAKSKSNPNVKYKNANLVLVEEKTLPHSFLNSIFINFNDYNNRNIEDELYSHELVHVSQKHTLDILFIEFLKVIFWFNPLFIFYKKAIQLNHEFLADEEIVKTYNNVPFYQNLLLQKGNGNQTIYLASNLNYLVTKKRLIMMTKRTSQKTAFLKKIAIVPILSLLVFLLCFKTIAQEKVIDIDSKKVSIKKKSNSNKTNEVFQNDFDTVKKKKNNIEKPKPTYCPETPVYKDEKITIEKIDDKSNLADYKKSEVKNLKDFNPGNLKNGYIYMTDKGTFFFIKKDDNTIEYYNRWGLRVNEKGEETTKRDFRNLIEVDEKPEYIGGIEEFYKFIRSNYKTPLNDLNQKVSGRIYAEFIIEKDGSLSNINVIRDIGYKSGEEAKRVLEKCPKWKPGKINNELVRVKYTLPIKISDD